MKKNKYSIPFNDPLNAIDAEDKTFGCRQRNPDICKYNGLEGTCAFANEDHICYKPSRAWKGQYSKLKGESKED